MSNNVCLNLIVIHTRVCTEHIMWLGDLNSHMNIVHMHVYESMFSNIREVCTCMYVYVYVHVHEES